jgi:antitoxin component of MazEF toxin-antitoxin module
VYYNRKIRKIGNSLGVILPSDLLKYLELKEGSSVNVTMSNEKIVIEPEPKNNPSPKR